MLSNAENEKASEISISVFRKQVRACPEGLPTSELLHPMD